MEGGIAILGTHVLVVVGSSLAHGIKLSLVAFDLESVGFPLVKDALNEVASHITSCLFYLDERRVAILDGVLLSCERRFRSLPDRKLAIPINNLLFSQNVTL